MQASLFWCLAVSLVCINCGLADAQLLSLLSAEAEVMPVVRAELQKGHLGKVQEYDAAFRRARKLPNQATPVLWHKVFQQYDDLFGTGKIHGDMDQALRRPSASQQDPHKYPSRSAALKARMKKSFFIFSFRQEVPQDVAQAFEFAGRVVSAFFESMRVKVKVAVDWRPLDDEVLAHAGPTAFYKVVTDRHRGTKMVWLPKALMNQRVEYPPPDMNKADMVLTINSMGSWFTGLDGNIAHGQYDLVTVVIHELQHGLGFLSLIGQGGYVNGVEAFPEAEPGEPYIFDIFVHDQEELQILSKASDGPSTLATVMEDVSALVWKSNSFPTKWKPQLYMPSAFDGASSISHLDETTYPMGSASSLMTPVLAKQELGGMVIRMYQDMGYKMRDCTSYYSCGACVTNLCRWCFDGERGECGDPGAFPFSNSLCHRTNYTDVPNALHCPIEIEHLAEIDNLEHWTAQKGDHITARNEKLDIVVSIASNECYGIFNYCILTYQQKCALNMVSKVSMLLLPITMLAFYSRSLFGDKCALQGRTTVNL